MLFNCHPRRDSDDGFTFFFSVEVDEMLKLMSPPDDS